MKNVTKFLAIIALISVAAFSIAACKSADEKAADELQGTWKNTDYDMEFTFKGDSVTMKMAGSESKGTFATAGGILTCTFTEGDFKDIPMAFSYKISGNTFEFTSGTYNGLKLTKK